MESLVEERQGEGETPLKLVACPRKSHTPGRALEQRGPDLLLEPPDPLTQRRLGDEQAIGRVPEVQLFGRDQKRLPQARVYFGRHRGTSLRVEALACASVMPSTMFA